MIEVQVQGVPGGHQQEFVQVIKLCADYGTGERLPTLQKKKRNTERGILPLDESIIDEDLNQSLQDVAMSRSILHFSPQILSDNTSPRANIEPHVTTLTSSYVYKSESLQRSYLENTALTGSLNRSLNFMIRDVCPTVHHQRKFRLLVGDNCRHSIWLSSSLITKHTIFFSQL